MKERKNHSDHNECRRLNWRRYRPRRRMTIAPWGFAAPVLNIAVLFVVFLVLKSEIILRPGVNLRLPQAAFVDGAPTDSMPLVMTQEGLIFFNDERVPMDELAFAFRQAAHSKEQMCLNIEADLRVQYGMIIRVINTAFSAGIRNINLATRPVFGEAIMP